MISKFLGRFSQDMGVDLGTANTLVYVKGKGIVINEPSVVAINTIHDQIVAVGHDAKRMIGKTPGHISVTKPLSEGVVSDFEVAEKMLKHFIEKVHRETFTVMPRPRMVVGVPMDVTEVERKAVEDAALNAGAREVFLIEEPMAAAIGARLPVQDSSGSMIVDIGGGTTEIAVISLGGIVTWKSLRVAGDELNQAIIAYGREECNLLLGEKTSEDIKIALGAALELRDPLQAKMRGRDLVSGLPKEVVISSSHIREALSKVIATIVTNIKETIERTPPELSADIYQRGIVLSGGGAMIRGLDKVLEHETQIPVSIVEDPLTCVARGTGLILEDLESLKDLFILSSSDERFMK